MRSPTRRHLLKLTRIVLIPLAMFIALGCWAISSPVGSSPDDDFHLSSVWCAWGNRGDLCGPGATPTQRTLPADLVTNAYCFHLDPNASAACQGLGFGSRPETSMNTSRGNFSGLYPPVFYDVLGTFASNDLHRSVIIMRLFNAALFVGIVTLTYFTIRRDERSALVWSLAVTMVPLGMFLIPSTNPSSWALLSAGVLWIAVRGHMRARGWRRWLLAGLAMLVAIMGGGARADSAAYSILGVILAVFLEFRIDRKMWRNLVLPVVIVVVSVAFYLSASQSTSLVDGLNGVAPTTFAEWRKLFLINVTGALELWSGVFTEGHWGLGWLDTTMPAGVWFCSLAVFIGAIALGLRSRTPRAAIALAGGAAIAVLLPAYMLTQSGVLIGGYVQPRYILPLLVMLTGVAITSTRSGFPRPGRLGLGVAIGGLATANAIALHTEIRRYVTGYDVIGINLDAHAEWWGSAGSPMLAWIVGTLAFTFAMIGIAAPAWRVESSTAPRFRRLRRSGSPERTDPTRSSTASPSRSRRTAPTR